jgi:16S rRNA (guanine527-N7)-methyltransferase
VDEEEARAWLSTVLAVPRETLDALDRFVALLREEAGRQNLVAASTLDHVWTRHIVDSAQLLLHSGRRTRWLDLGSGAGFPGLVVATLGKEIAVTLVESRRKRIEFLAAAAEILGVRDRVTIAGNRVEALPDAKFDAISARAFAPLERLLPLAHRFARPETIWLLPKGRSSACELESARGSWQGVFRVEASVTDPDATIIVATHVLPRGKR